MKKMLGYFSEKAADLYGFNVWESEESADKLVYTTMVVTSGWSPMGSKWEDEKFAGYLGEHVKSYKEPAGIIRL